VSAKRSLITTPIYYVNDVPHVGHAYTTIAADTLARARRLEGRDVFFLTGTDEHGQNIERIARERGVGEQEYSDKISARFKDLWRRFDIVYDRFIRTTEDVHRRGVLKLWGNLVRAKTPDGQDAIYRGRYSGWYCPRCEGFKDEDELLQPGNLCPDHERPCEWTEEENFFFRLSAYEGWLREEIESGRIRIDPEARRNEILSLLGQGLRDFSVSRARVRWGIPVPEQPDHVLYVWVDALSNYVTALDYADDGPLFEKYWTGAGERLHLLGKDIIRFHCLYWPALLRAAGLEVPNRFFVQGWLTKGGKKLSKTTGNIIDPEALVDQWGPDVLRYFLLRDGTYGQDWDVTDEAIVSRYNADLANDFGNLVSRALTMAVRYCGGRIPGRPAEPAAHPRGIEEELELGLEKHAGAILLRYEALDFSGALVAAWSLVSQLNQRIVVVAPWALAKDAARQGELEAFLYRLLEAIRLVAVLVSPVMPRACGRVLRTLGMAPEVVPADLAWGRIVPSSPLGPVEPLFPRIEKTEDALRASSSKELPVSDTPPEAGGPIDIADFNKIELKVAKILSAEKIPGARKLLKLEVSTGAETRQIVSGIAETYTPESLVGREVVLVANLKPAKLMGVESNGMVLAASVDGKAVLCTFDQEVAPGTKVK
jgi:methionyl-tRNA synthetase